MPDLQVHPRGPIDGKWYFRIFHDISDESSRAGVSGCLYDSYLLKDSGYATKQEAMEAGKIKAQELTRGEGS